MNWFKSKLNKRVRFLEEKIASIENPFQFETGDSAWFCRYEDNNTFTYHKVIVIKPRSEFIMGHACMIRYNYYLVLKDKIAFDVDENYLSKTKPKQSKPNI